MAGDILNVNLTLINIMEQYLLIYLLIMLIALFFSLIVVVIDCSVFKRELKKFLI